MARTELKCKVNVRKVKLAGRKLNEKKQAGLNVSRIDEICGENNYNGWECEY